MKQDLAQRLIYELSNLEYERSVYAHRLALCDSSRDKQLKRTHRARGGAYYYCRRRGQKKYEYLGTDSNPEVRRIREAHFLEAVIDRIDRNIELIKALANGFLPYSEEAVNEALPEVYRSYATPELPEYELAGAEWKKAQLEFQARFPENYPEHKTETTSDGIKVKSVSELLMYEQFKSAGFAQVYELPIPADDYGPPLYPDFSILSPVDMKSTIIVEYVGMLDLYKYRDAFVKRIGRLIDSGYIPGVNLFFVFSDKGGHVDSLQISKVIADIRGIRI